jgi:RsiW-degrading membrane proteinase PrsW (M82 family)
MIFGMYAAIFAPLIFMLFILKKDNRRLILFFMWGLTAALMAYFANSFVCGWLNLDFGGMSRTIAPFVEEILKALPLCLYFFSKDRANLYEAPKNAMAVGIGFSVLENYYYLSSFQGDGAKLTVLFIVARSLSACLLHGTLTGFTGFAIRICRVYQLASPFAVLGALCAAIVTHAAFNQLAFFPQAQALSVLLPCALFAIELFLWNFYGARLSAQPANEDDGRTK